MDRSRALKIALSVLRVLWQVQNSKKLSRTIWHFEHNDQAPSFKYTGCFLTGSAPKIFKCQPVSKFLRFYEKVLIIRIYLPADTKILGAWPIKKYTLYYDLSSFAFHIRSPNSVGFLLIYRGLCYKKRKSLLSEICTLDRFWKRWSSKSNCEANAVFQCYYCTIEYCYVDSAQTKKDVPSPDESQA